MFRGVYWDVLEVLGCFGLLEFSGNFGFLGRCGTFWEVLEYLGHLGKFWDSLDILGHSGRFLGVFRQFGLFRMCWVVLKRFGTYYDILGRFKTFLNVLGCFVCSGQKQKVDKSSQK